MMLNKGRGAASARRPCATAGLPDACDTRPARTLMQDKPRRGASVKLTGIMHGQALKTIRDEHEVLSAMLHSMRLLLEHQRGRQGGPDFGLLRAMLFYVDEFPNRLHHPKEEALLFPRVRAACPEIAEVLD